MVRQGVYRNVYEEKGKVVPAFDGPEYLVMMHIGKQTPSRHQDSVEDESAYYGLLDHCIELLRIHMQCHVDTTPYLIKLDESVPIGYKADFSTHQKCRNFDKVRQWVVDNTAIP